MTKWRSDMSHGEKMAWHTEVYAFRRVRLGISRDERTSPPDPEGKWFNEPMVNEAERAMRQRSEARTERNDAAVAAEASAVLNQWAQQHGHADFDAYKRADGLEHTDACRRVIASMATAATLKNHEAFSDPPDADPKALLQALGVTAHERTYTPEEMRQARIQLGLEPPDPPEGRAAPFADRAAG